MPVRFIVDPKLPDNVHTITLSYTFYKNDTLTAQLPPAGNTTKTAGVMAGVPATPIPAP